MFSMVMFFWCQNPSFQYEQMRYPRYRHALSEKKAVIDEMFASAGLSHPPASIFLRVFKRDRVLELWARNEQAKPFRLVTSYAICADSGILGPKRQEGDLQVPEGFYVIDRFNPASQFHLSLGINYPNQSDRRLGVQGNLGGDIFIHGACVTIGCIPLTDDVIKTLYVVAVAARAAGQKSIPVHIFPTRLDPDGLKSLLDGVADDDPRRPFWQGLVPGYQIFEQTHRLPRFNVDKQGRYRLRSQAK